MPDYMKHAQPEDEAQDEPETNAPRRANVIGDNTPIRLGFIIALLAMCAGGFGLWIWWAATISSKMDTMIAQQTAMMNTANGHTAAIADLQAWRKLIDTVGTPSMVSKTTELDKKLSDLQREFELHKATTMKP